MAFKSEIHVAELASIRTGHTEGDIYYILDNGMLGDLPCKPGTFVKWHNDAWQIQPDEHYALASAVDGEIAQAIDNVLDDGSASEAIVVAVPSSQSGDYVVGNYYEVQGKVARLRTKTEGDNVTQLTFDTTSGLLEAINNSGKISVFYVTFPSGVKTYPDPDEILAAIDAGKFVVIDEPNQGVWEHTLWLLQRANRGLQDHIYFEWKDLILVAERDNAAAEPTWQWNTGYLYDNQLDANSTNAVQNRALDTLLNGEGSGEGFRELKYTSSDGLQFVKTHPSTKILSEGFPVDSVDYQLVRTFNGFIYKNITGWKVDGTVTVGLWNYDTKQYVAEVALNSTSDQSPDTIAVLTEANASDEMELHVKGSGTIGAIMGAI